MRRLAAALLVVTLAAGCDVQVGETGSAEGPTVRVIDLTVGRDRSLVGWPDEHDLSLYEVPLAADAVTLVLPGGASLEGVDDVVANTVTPTSRELDFVVARYDLASIEEAAIRAVEMLERLGASPDQVASVEAWSRQQREAGAGARAMERVNGLALGDRGATANLLVRASPDGTALVVVEVDLVEFRP